MHIVLMSIASVQGYLLWVEAHQLGVELKTVLE